MKKSTVKYRIDAVDDVVNKLRIDESRFINCCLLGVEQRVRFKEENYYPVDIRTYAVRQNIDIGKAFNEVLAICKFHKENSLAISVGGSAVLHTSLIYEYREDIDDKTVYINWNPKFIPYISGEMEPGKFLTVDICMDGVPSNRRYSMYLLIAKHLWRLEREGTFSLTKEEIRKGLNLGETEYKEFNVLNSKVIKPTLEAIKNKLGKSIQVRLSKGTAIFAHKDTI
jgi:hypothetical protein